jgi:hypothetical protein
VLVACAIIPFSALAQFKIYVEPGSPDEASKYYERIGTELGFKVVGSTLDGLLNEAGYTIPADNLEALDPSAYEVTPIS